MAYTTYNSRQSPTGYGGYGQPGGFSYGQQPQQFGAQNNQQNNQQNLNQMGTQNPYGGYQGYNPDASKPNQGIYPGPYGQPNVKNQQEYNGNWQNQMNQNNPYSQGFDQAMNQFNQRNWGDWSDPRNAAGNQMYSTSYMQPYLQFQQNARTQSFNESSWAANFAEQQYLNKNQTALDWASNQREDAGLNYAIQSGNRQFEADQKQMGVANRQKDYDLFTQRAQQEAMAQYQRGQITLGEAQNRIDSARQQADAIFQQGQVKNDKTKIANEYQIAQEQNRIDEMFKSGQLSNEQYNAETARLRANNELSIANQQNATTLELGRGQLGIDRTKVNNDYAIAQKQNEIDQMYKTGLLTNEQYNSETARLRAENEMTLGQGQLAQQRYATDQETMLGRLGIDQQRYATDKDYAAAMAGIGQQRYATDKDFELGQGNLQNQQFQAQTGRMQVQNEYQVAQQQLQLDTMYRTGQLSNEQYQAQTARLQQQSQQNQWQQQLAQQQSQFGQELAFRQQELQANLLSQRLNAFGRLRGPNMAAWNRQWS